MCASLRFQVRERSKKYLLLPAWHKELYGPGPQFFCYSIGMNIYTQNLLVSNSGQHTYVAGLFNFFFVLQDLIDWIVSYFQRIVFQRNLLLISFYHSTSQVFSDVNKQSSLKWHCINWKGGIMAESGRWLSNIKISILLKKGWFSNVRVSLKWEE